MAKILFKDLIDGKIVKIELTKNNDDPCQAVSLTVKTSTGEYADIVLKSVGDQRESITVMSLEDPPKDFRTIVSEHYIKK